MLVALGIDAERDHDRVLVGLDPVQEQHQQIQLAEVPAHQVLQLADGASHEAA